jgi:hypothetical protein
LALGDNCRLAVRQKNVLPPKEVFSESVEDKENFIVQPFIDLLGQEAYAGAQVIITGASFQGLEGVHRNKLTKPYVG